MATLLTPLRQAWRSLTRDASTTAAALAALALGIGGTSAVHGIVDAVVLQPPRVVDHESLACIWPEKRLNEAMVTELRESTTSFESVSAVANAQLTLVGDTDTELVDAAAVTTDYFTTLRSPPPLVGRSFVAGDAEPGGEAVVVLSEAVWERLFGSDPQIVGRSIELGGRGLNRRTVIGVAPRAFRPPGPSADAWVPLPLDPTSPLFNGAYGLTAWARLRDGVTLAEANADVRRLVPSVRERHAVQFRPGRESPTDVVAVHELMVRGVAGLAWLVSAAVGVVLLVACVNVASLLLARATARRREMAIRLALGAQRPRLVGVLLAEGLVLALVGGAAGLLLAAWTLDLARPQLAAMLPSAAEARLHGGVLAFTAVTCIGASLLFAIVPALRATDVSASVVLAEEGRGSTAGRERHRLQWTLVASEIALALGLCILAGLVVRSLVQLQRQDVGLAVDEIVAARFALPRERYGDAAMREQFQRGVVERLANTPGVLAAACVNDLPLTGGASGFPYHVEGEPAPQGVSSLVVYFRTITPEYFDVMGVPILQGRSLEDDDVSVQPIVGVINETMARRHWPDGDALGQNVLAGDGSTIFSVIGVAADTRSTAASVPSEPEVYLHAAALSWRPGWVVARVAGDPRSALPGVRLAIKGVDEEAGVVSLQTMRQVADGALGNARLVARVFSAFAALALALAAIGVHGVVAYVTARRTREVGIRIALGATRISIVRTMIRSALLPVAAGLTGGALLALALGRTWAALLYDVSAADPLTQVGAAAAMAAVALLSALGPAWRAARLHALDALRGG